MIMTCAIIGIGRMGKRHIQASKKSSIELIALYDICKDSLKNAIFEYGLDNKLAYSSLDNMYSNRIPELLIISTTAESHCGLVCQAAEFGVKYILVEKPLAVSIDECETMIQICKKHGSLLSVNHQMRFLEQYSLVKDLMNSKAYGGVQGMTVIGGNFGLAMNGSHYFEAFRYLTDEEPFEVTAWFDDVSIPNPRGNQFEDKSGCIRIITKTGKRFYLDVSSGQGHGLEVVYASRNGHIHVSELYGELISTVRNDEYLDLPTTRYGMPAIREKTSISPVEVVDSSAKVLDALLNDSNRVTGEQGMLAVQVLVAAYQSAENGNIPIKLDQISDTNKIRKFPWA
jgi:predicted dehydrogenase